MRTSLPRKPRLSTLTSLSSPQPTRLIPIPLTTRTASRPLSLGPSPTRRPTAAVFSLTKSFSTTTTATTSTATMSSPQPKFSPGSDPAALQAALAPLLKANGGRWVLAADGEALEREFKFKTFAKTWVRDLPPEAH